jgi:uncharacterized protein YfaT (DUF1175 family)
MSKKIDRVLNNAILSGSNIRLENRLKNNGVTIMATSHKASITPSHQRPNFVGIYEFLYYTDKG